MELTRRGSTPGAGNRVWSGRTGVRGWSVVETHGQWAGLRLRRTSASGKLVKVRFSPRVADFVWNSRCQGHWVPATCLAFSVPQLDLQLQSRVLCWGRPAPVCCPATHSSRDPATGDLISTSEREREREKERAKERDEQPVVPHGAIGMRVFCKCILCDSVFKFVWRDSRLRKTTNNQAVP